MRGLALDRPVDDRILGGVCAGLGDRVGVSAWWVRAAFVLLTLADGLGVVVYALIWLLTPTTGRKRESLGSVLRHNARALPDELALSRRRIDEVMRGPDARRLLAVVMVGGGAAVLLWSVGALGWLSGARLAAIVAIIAGIALLNAMKEGR